METLREIISKIDTNKSNLNGSKESFDNLTIHDVYEIAEIKIQEMCLQYNMNNFSLPKIKGYNSLVIYTDSIMEDKIFKYAIKIHVYNKNDIKDGNKDGNKDVIKDDFDYTYKMEEGISTVKGGAKIILSFHLSPPLKRWSQTP